MWYRERSMISHILFPNFVESVVIISELIDILREFKQDAKVRVMHDGMIPVEYNDTIPSADVFHALSSKEGQSDRESEYCIISISSDKTETERSV